MNRDRWFTESATQIGTHIDRLQAELKFQIPASSPSQYWSVLRDDLAQKVLAMEDSMMKHFTAGLPEIRNISLVFGDRWISDFDSLGPAKHEEIYQCVGLTIGLKLSRGYIAENENETTIGFFLSYPGLMAQPSKEVFAKATIVEMLLKTRRASTTFDYPRVEPHVSLD